MSISSDQDLVGLSVVSNDGHVIGTISRLMVNTRDWKVTRVEVSVRREALEALGLKKPWVRSQEIEVPVDEIGGLSDTAVLRHDVADLEFAGGEKADD